MLFGGRGPKWRSGSCVPGDEKAQNRSSVALHALSYSMSQTVQNVIKKKKQGGMLVTEILNTCTRWSNKRLPEISCKIKVFIKSYSA